MPKPRVHQFDPADGAPLDFVRINADGTAVGYDDGADLAGVQSVVEGTGITIDDTDPANPVISATGGGGGGGGAGNDRRWNVGASETTIDEFNDDTLDAAWTRVDGTGASSGNLAWEEGADTLVANHTTGNDTSAVLHALLQPLSGVGGAVAVGDGFVTCLTIQSEPAQYHMGGLILSTAAAIGSGQQLFTLNFATLSATPQSNDLRAHSGFNTSVTGGTGSMPTPLGSPTFIRLSRITSTTWRQDISTNGVSWRIGPALVTWSNVPTYVGFLSSNWGSGRAGQVAYEFIRRVTGIT